MTEAPIRRGVLLALAAAAAFGLTTPFVKLFSAEAGAFPTAALLYGGAAFASIRMAGDGEPPVRCRHLGRLFLVSLAGAVVAPVCFAWGLSTTSAAAGSLLLNLEAVFTVFLGWTVHREPLGRQMGAALLLMLAGGACLVLSQSNGGLSVGWGALAIAAAALAWATDNALTRPLADLDPVAVTRSKAALGATLTLAAALLSGARWPTASGIAGLLVSGAVGYGLSLRLYLLAQRVIGAGRTGSIFGVAPFLGAAVAWGLGDRAGGTWTVGATLLFALGVLLHATERHSHWHVHDALEHEHAHRHDDGHHAHAHVPPVEGEHSHTHSHEAGGHDHPHGSDLHHEHH